jgi:hypothetical protein
VTNKVSNQDRSKSHRALLDLISGYAKLADDLIDQGLTAHLMTFMYAPLSGSFKALLIQMRREIESVYKRFLTRVVRKPRSLTSRDRLPILIAAADLPGFRSRRSPLGFVLVNDGIHFHALLFIPPSSRLRESADEHFVRNQRGYVGDRSRIDRIDVRPIKSNPDRVVSYVMKTLRSGRLDYDEAVLILPRAVSEL